MTQLPHLQLNSIYPESIASLTNSGIEEPIASGVPAPKYAIGQKIVFAGKAETYDAYTAFGTIVGISYYEEAIFYAVQDLVAVGDNTPAALEWLAKYEGDLVQVLEEYVVRAEIDSPPAPKFAPDQEVAFQVTFIVAAVIDGTPQWIDTTQEYLYSVRNAQLLENPVNIYCLKSDLEVDTENSMFSEKQLFTHIIRTDKGEITPDLSS